MDAIQLTGSDAAQIALALIADRHEGQSGLHAGQLQSWWQALGLRADDLIQALSVLSRDGDLKIEGEGETAILHLQPPALARLPTRGSGLAGLPSILKETLQRASERSAGTGGHSAGERRDGFK
mgnify:CR=1 FL=1